MSRIFDRLQSAATYVSNGRFTQAFIVYWQRFCERLEQAISDLEAVNDVQGQMLIDIQTALDNAGIALANAQASMPDIAPVKISADYTGAVLGGQLPRNVVITRTQAGVDVTTEADWSADLVSGEVTFTIGAATGILSITAIGASSIIQVTSERDGITLSRKVTVTKELGDPPPSSGAGSDSAYDNSISSTSSDTYGAANAGPITLTCGASGEVDLAAPLTVTVEEVSPDGSFGVFGKWQYRLSGGGAWTDAGTEIQNSIPAVLVDEGGGLFSQTEGQISVNQSVSGLTASSDYEFQLLLRADTGTRTRYFVGSASAVTE